MAFPAVCFSVPAPVFSPVCGITLFHSNRVHVELIETPEKIVTVDFKTYELLYLLRELIAYFFFFFVFLPFLGPLPWHMEIPRLGV